MTEELKQEDIKITVTHVIRVGSFFIAGMFTGAGALTGIGVVVSVLKIMEHIMK